ncbi:MAG: T9SS type A sorting domain-containing protein [Flavobacteriales bacterium]|nr:T9SS type A sorting domain-containing protein [Flavobacteriales bacterium]
MKKIYNLFLGLMIVGTAANAQVVFQSNLSSWSGGLPTDWMGSSTSITAANVTEVTAEMYGTSAAKLKNTAGSSSHKRFSTKTVNVDLSGTYEIKMWVKASAGQLRTNYYNPGSNGYGTYNSYIDLATASAGQLVMLTQTVTVSGTTDSAQFILSIHSTDGINDIIVDSVVITNTAPPVATPYTINQIQFTTTPPYDSPHNTEYVQTSGVVTAVQYNGYYLQDGNGPWNGVFVLDFTNIPSLGDVVTITGTVDEYFNYTTIKNIINYNAVAGGTIPTPQSLTTFGANDEQYEGVLVKVMNATCNADTATNGFGEWTINDGSGDLRVDNKMYTYAPTISTAYNVTGVMDYSFSIFKLLPRNAGDVSVATSIDEINDIKVSVYPNPVQNQINFELSTSNYAVRIIDITGKTISNTTSIANKLKVNTSSLNNGIYFYTILNDNGNVITTNKFIVAK